jgi:predicted MFS family arabinose efflux permease
MIAFPLDMIHIWCGAAAFTAFSCLALDQVPNDRATMMSMRSVFGSVGGAVGAALAGAMLIIFGSYQAVGISFGIMSVASAGAFLLTRDPTKRPSTDDKYTL